MEINMRKGHYGWAAESYKPMSFEIEGKPAFLKVNTMKGSSGLIETTARIVTRDGMFEQTRIFRDFHRTIQRTDKRATEKAVRQQHEDCLRDELQTSVALAIQFHREKGDITEAADLTA